MRASSVLFLLPLVLFSQLKTYNAADLAVDFYQKSCPRAERIVRDITWSNVKSNPNLPAKLLRMQFHDCFVLGCDASILLDGKNSEKTAIPNAAIRGFEVIDAIKAQLEKECPETVSCADIIALAARDAVSFQFRKALWQVETGRRDGNVSLASNVNVPSPQFGFAKLRLAFAQRKLNVADLVALSGAHTIGRANCAFVTPRLYQFKGPGNVDPLLEASFVVTLKKMCPNPSPARASIEMDMGSSLSFDSSYFTAVKNNRGVFLSDAALLRDPVAARLVSDFENQNTFFTQFSKSITRMGAIGVLTGNAGQIRKQCRAVN